MLVLSYHTWYPFIYNGACFVDRDSRQMREQGLLQVQGSHPVPDRTLGGLAYSLPVPRITANRCSLPGSPSQPCTSGAICSAGFDPRGFENCIYPPGFLVAAIA